MGCVSTREKSNYFEESSIINKHDKNYLVKMLILKTDYEKYTFKVREDPEDAFADILRSWGKLSKNVNENSFPDLSSEFNEIEDSFLDETSQMEVPTEVKKELIRKNTIALKNLEIMNIEEETPVPSAPPTFSFSKILVDNIKKVNAESNIKNLVKKDSIELFGNTLSPGTRVGRTSQVSFDLLSKN